MILRSRLRFAVAASLPPTGNVQGDGLVLSTDGHLYIWDGTAWVDHGATGGGGGGPAGVSQATVDFGAVPSMAKAFDVSDALAGVGQHVLTSIGTDAVGDFEGEPLCVSAFVVSTGLIRVIVAATGTGRVSGLVKVNYLLGNTPVADGELVTAGVGPFDDFDPQGNRVLAFSGLATLSGILAPTGNALRSHILVCPVGLNVEHEGAGSAAANRVELGIYAPGPLAIYTCHVVYDSITQRWRLASAP